MGKYLVIQVVTRALSCLTLWSWNSHLGTVYLNLYMIRLVFKFQCMVYDSVLFEETKTKLLSKWHVTENKT
jgi:hypothetical protein